VAAARPSARPAPTRRETCIHPRILCLHGFLARRYLGAVIGFLLVFFAVQSVFSVLVLQEAHPKEKKWDRALLIDAGGLTLFATLLQFLFQRHIGYAYLLPQVAVIIVVLNHLLSFSFQSAVWSALKIATGTVLAAFTASLLFGSPRAARVPVPATPAPAAAVAAAPAPTTTVAQTAVPAPAPVPPPPADEAAAGAVPPGEWDAASRKLRISAVGRGEGRVCILVDNRVVTNGAAVTVDHLSSRYTWEVRLDGSDHVRFLPRTVAPVGVRLAAAAGNGASRAGVASPRISP